MKFYKIALASVLFVVVACSPQTLTDIKAQLVTATPVPSPTITPSPTPIPEIEATVLNNTFLFPCEVGDVAPALLNKDTKVILRGKYKELGVVYKNDLFDCAVIPLRDIDLQADVLPELPSTEFSSMAYGSAFDEITPKNAQHIDEVLTIGKGIIENVTFTPDGEFLIVTTLFNVNIFDGNTFEYVNSIQTPVHFIGFSPDGKFLYTVSGATEEKKGVYVWNLHDISLEQTLYLNTTSIKSFSISPDGEMFLTAGERGVILWNAQNGKLVKNLNPNKTASSSAFSNNGEYIAAGLEGKVLLYKADSSSSLLWEADFQGRRGNIDRTFSEVPAIPDKIIFSRDDTTLTVLGGIQLGDQSSAYLYQISDGGSERTFVVFTESSDGHLRIRDGFFNIFVSEDIEGEWVSTKLELDEKIQGTFLSFSISPDNKKLAGATWGGTIQIWDLETYSIQTTISGFSKRIVNLDINKDGSLIAFVVAPDNDRGGTEIFLWDTWHEIAIPLPEENYGFVFDIKFFPEKPMIVTSVYDEDWRKRKVHVFFWSTETNEIVETYTHSALAGGMINIASDGSRMAINIGPDTNRVYVWDVGRTNQAILERRTYFPGTLATGAMSNSISSDGSLLAYEIINPNTGERQVKVDNIAEKSEILSIEDTIGSIQFVSNSQKLFIATYQSSGPELQIRDMNSSPKLRTFKIDGWNPDVDIAISPDGQVVALVDFSNNIQVYTIGNTFSLVTTLSGHQKQINEIKFSQDGRFLVSGGEDGTIKLWAVMP